MGLDNPLHIAVLVVILLLVFGARRLPEIGRSLGSGMREFRQSISGESQRSALNAPASQAEATRPSVEQQPVAAAPVQAAQPPTEAPPTG